ncbi:MAG: hypoxanthine phosphoribosyltransferase [Saprospiraceae bacterium]|nr:hypoxanthine phosphoribosyltransferase [Saprospiraceae bacterium]
MNESQIQIEDLIFDRYILAEDIDMKISEIATNLNSDYADRYPLFLVVMNGAFIFAADLMRKLSIPCELSFVRIKSYQGTSSTGKIDIFMPPDVKIEGRHIVIVEDIIDTGNTLNAFIPHLNSQNPASLSVTAILVKPDAHIHEIKTEYPGFVIPEKFVVGFGLDYNGKGRNLPDLYQLAH